MKRFQILSISCIIASAIILSASCGKKSSVEGITLYEPEYSEHFQIDSYGEHSSILEIRNPWQGAEGVSSQLFISRNGEEPPTGFDGNVVYAPLKRVVCMSSSYIAFIDALNEVETVKGVSGASYISNPIIRSKYKKGTVRDIGFDGNMNFELLASLKPDLVMIYGVVSENTVMTDKLRELHIPVVYIGDYLESTPLGKSEWIVAFGELYDKREDAAAIFKGISSSYNATCEAVRNLPDTDIPKVMLNAPYNDVWFVPGDRSYMVELIRAAGGEYLFAGSDNTISRPISTETAYVASKEADVWLNPNQIRTISELTALNPAFSEIKVVKDRNVYNAIKRDTPEGGSDFWESGALRADLVLKDLVRIIRPELEPERELYYYKRLE